MTDLCCFAVVATLLAVGDTLGIAESPASVTVEKGNNFTLTCRGSNTTNLNYKWYKSSSIPTTVMSGSSLGSSETYTVNQAQVSDAGYYQCRIASSNDVVYSDVAQVSVVYFDTVAPKALSKEVSTTTESVRLALPCSIDSAVSNPAYFITWHKDGAPFSSDTGYTARSASSLKIDTLDELSIEANSLVLFNLNSSDSGRYECRAYVGNDAITIKNQTVVSWELNVRENFPNVEYQSNPEVTGGAGKVGQAVTLYCGAAGYRDGKVPIFTWFHESDTVTSGDTYNLLDYGRSLVIKSATTSSSFSCKACISSTCKQATTTASVTTAVDSLSFTSPLSHYVLYTAGLNQGALDITCTTNHGAGSWLKNGQSVTMPIVSPQPSDSGVYQCYAKSSDHWVARTTQITVSQKMEVTMTAPSEVTYQTSADTVVTCKVSGSPAPTVKLYKTNSADQLEAVNTCYTASSDSKGCVRKNGEQYLITVDTNYLNSSGTYRCDAEQSIRQLDGSYEVTQQTKNSTLAVVLPVDVYEVSTDNSTITHGDRITVTCRVKGGRPPFKVDVKMGSTTLYSWRLGSTSVGDGHCVGSYEKSCFVHIHSVDYSHEGTVTCLASNIAAGNTTKTDAMALATNVIRPITLIVSGNFFPVNGSDLTLTCTYHEKPYNFNGTQVAWYFNNRTIVPEGVSVVSHEDKYEGSIIATFQNMGPSNEGLYSCESKGILSNPVNVYVNETGSQSAPTVESVNVPEGKAEIPMNLTCIGHGYPPPDLHWIIYPNKSVANNTYITKEKFKTKLIFEWMPQKADEMPITCVATNLNGTAALSTNLKILYKDGPLPVDNRSDEGAIIAACIIAAIIIIICIIFCCLCILKKRKKDEEEKDEKSEYSEPPPPMVPVDGDKPAADKEHPYTSLDVIKKKFRNKWDRIAHPEKAKNPEKTNYAEIIGEVKNKEAPQDADIILQPTIVPGDSEADVPSKKSKTSGPISSSSSSSRSKSKKPVSDI